MRNKKYVFIARGPETNTDRYYLCKTEEDAVAAADGFSASSYAMLSAEFVHSHLNYKLKHSEYSRIKIDMRDILRGWRE